MFWGIIRRDVSWPIVRKWWRQNNRVGLVSSYRHFKVPPGFLCLLAGLLCEFCPQCQDHHGKSSLVGNTTAHGHKVRNLHHVKAHFINQYQCIHSKLRCFSGNNSCLQLCVTHLYKSLQYQNFVWHWFDIALQLMQNSRKTDTQMVRHSHAEWLSVS